MHAVDSMKLTKIWLVNPLGSPFCMMFTECAETNYELEEAVFFKTFIMQKWGELLHTVHASHSCYVCQKLIPWVGDVVGDLTISHGQEVHAEIAVVKGRNAQGQVELGISLQCPHCGVINRFEALHFM